MAFPHQDIKSVSTQDWHAPQAVMVLSLLGLFVSLTVAWTIGLLSLSAHIRTFLLLLAALSIGGYIFRTARRQLFFGPHHTVHQALSFEALFQGAILLFPQLPYPNTEAAFLNQQTGLPQRQIDGWFRIRSAGALIIPAVLLGIILWSAGLHFVGVLLWLVAGATFIQCVRSFNLEYSSYTSAWRFGVALVLGLLAVIWEGTLFSWAGLTVLPNIPIWQWLLLYFLTLTVFEMSPIPLALGALEIMYGAFALLFGLGVAAILLPLGYRLFRGFLLVSLLLFYLPRYKLSLIDIYHPALPLAFTRRVNTLKNPNLDSAKSKLLLSIVIPAFNEERRLPAYLPKVIKFAQTIKGGVEIIVVDDGSTDGTVAYVQSLMANMPLLQLIKQSRNLGKGAAVKAGMLASQGSYILFADADGSTPIEEAEGLLQVAKGGADVVIASRRMEGSLVSRALFRDMIGGMFYRLTNLLAVPGVLDTQCGFKLFPRDVAHMLFMQLTEKGWAFDVEMLYLAQKLGLTIVEVPVKWVAVEGSKVSVFKDAFRMFLSLIRIRRRWSGLANRIPDIKQD